MQSISKALILSILLLKISGIVHAGTLTSTVNRNQIGLNETITLQVSYDQQVNSSELDLRELNADFEVLAVNPQSSNSVSIVNGQASRQASTTWSITLVPKRSGTLTIPEFSIKQDKSEAITILAADNASTPPSQLPLNAWVAADKESVYPAQQLIVEIELSAQANVRDLNGPQLIVNGAHVEAIDQQNFRRIENGVERQIVLLKYAVFAEQAGQLTIPVMTYTGIRGGRRSFFGSRGEQVISRTTQFEIPVKPLPADSHAAWFPAEDVSISSTWSSDTSTVVVGEPITRTIQITAKGQRASLIPPIDQSSSAQSYKRYQDQPQLDDKTTSGGFIGTRTESEAIVVASSGEIILPEVKIDWWDVAADRWRTAVLPEEKLSVAAADGIMTAIESNSSSAGSEQLINQNRALQNGALQNGAWPGNNLLGNSLLWPIVCALLALLCMAQFYYIIKSNHRKSLPPKLSAADISEKQAWSKLQSSLKRQEAVTVRRDLLDWTKAAIPNNRFTNLTTLIQHAESFGDDGSQLASELAKMDAQIYQDGRSFDARSLATILLRVRKRILSESHPKNSGSLAPLYRH